MTPPPPVNWQAIERIVGYRSTITAEEVAEALFGEKSRVTDVYKDLDWLYKMEYIGRELDGSYYPARIGPSSLNANPHVRAWIPGRERK